MTAGRTEWQKDRELREGNEGKEEDRAGRIKTKYSMSVKMLQ